MVTYNAHFIQYFTVKNLDFLYWKLNLNVQASPTMTEKLMDRLNNISRQIQQMSKIVRKYTASIHVDEKPKRNPKNRKSRAKKENTEDNTGDAIPREVLDKSYKIYRSSRKVEEAISQRLLTKYYRIWRESFNTKYSSKNRQQKGTNEEKKDEIKDIESSDENDGYEFSKQDQNSDTENNNSFDLEEDDSEEVQDPEIKEILELKLSLGAGTGEEEDISEIK